MSSQRRKSKRLASKESYVSAIFIYKKRREKLKEKYQQQRRHYNQKLATYNQALQRIEIQEAKIKQVDKWIVDFLGESAKNTVNANSKNKILAKQFFCRYCMENGIISYYAKQYVGLTGANTISQNRRRLILKSAKEPELSNLWRQFNQFVKDAA